MWYNSSIGSCRTEQRVKGLKSIPSPPGERCALSPGFGFFFDIDPGGIPMKKAIAILLLLCLLSGCAPADRPQTGLTFTDDLGRTVAVSDPRRVACLLGSFSDIWHLSGGDPIAAPDDAWLDYHLPMTEGAVNLGSTKTLSLEALFAAEPDLVLASTNSAQHLQWQDTLEAAGIPVAYFEVSDFDGYLRLLAFCTGLTGRDDLYALHGTGVQAQIDEALTRAEARHTHPKVLYLRIAASGVRAKGSTGTVLGQMLQSLGCHNIADSDTSLLETLSLEHILLEDPDYIFIVRQGDDEEAAQAQLDRFFAENPAWAGLTAVREGRVFHLDKDLYNLKPNARWGEAYLLLEALLE